MDQNNFRNPKGEIKSADSYFDPEHRIQGWGMWVYCYLVYCARENVMRREGRYGKWCCYPSVFQLNWAKIFCENFIKRLGWEVLSGWLSRLIFTANCSLLDKWKWYSYSGRILCQFALDNRLLLNFKGSINMKRRKKILYCFLHKLLFYTSYNRLVFDRYVMMWCYFINTYIWYILLTEPLVV